MRSEEDQPKEKNGGFFFSLVDRHMNFMTNSIGAHFVWGIQWIDAISRWRESIAQHSRNSSWISNKWQRKIVIQSIEGSVFCVFSVPIGRVAIGNFCYYTATTCCVYCRCHCLSLTRRVVVCHPAYKYVQHCRQCVIKSSACPPSSWRTTATLPQSTCDEEYLAGEWGDAAAAAPPRKVHWSDNSWTPECN